MLGVQFARPENLHNCPGRGGAQKPAEPLQERARGSKMPEMRNEPSTLPRCEARPTPVCRPAPAPEDRGYPPGAPLEPGTRRKKLGENRAPEEHKDQSGHNGLPLLKRLLGPSFPRLPPSGHFTGPGVKPGRAPCPQPPPVLSLGTPAALPHSSIAPGRHPLLHHLRAWLVYAAPCFLSILSLSAQRSGGKAQTKKPPPRNFPAMRPCTKSSKTLMNPLLLLQPRTHGLEPSGSNVPYARLYGAVGWGG